MYEEEPNYSWIRENLRIIMSIIAVIFIAIGIFLYEGSISKVPATPETEKEYCIKNESNRFRDNVTARCLKYFE